MRRFSLLFAIVGLGACGSRAGSSTSSPAPEEPTPAPAENASTPDGSARSLADVGLSRAAMDSAADPCVDFYEYACGGWLESTEIPSDRSGWSRSFSEINQRNENTLRRILERAPNDDDASEAVAGAGAFYAACMNEPAIEKGGLGAVEPLFEAAAGIRRRADIAPVLARLHAHGIWPVFEIDVDQDFANPELVIAHFSQGGLGLPDRDYYLEDDERSTNLRTLYRSHVERMMALAGMPDEKARRAASDVMELETELARVSKTRVQMRDVAGIYNKIDAAGLERTVGALDWKAYFTGLGAPDLEHISVSGEEFFAGFDGLLRDQKPRAWSHYLQWHILHSTAPALPEAFVDESFRLQQAFSGQSEQKARWKRCVSQSNQALPHYVGRAFVDEMFRPEAKDAVERMVHGISNAFAEAVEGYEWMTDTTKKRALQKREMMAYLIGYPDEWDSYGFEVDPEGHAANTLAARADEVAKDLAKIGEPVDRSEWAMSPATVNAYYHPLKNHMVYPAAILQPPFFDPDAGLAVNLGGLGMIVGHELTHGFDDQGSRFAGTGAMENWWQPEDSEQFESRTQCVVEQYSGYQPLPDTHLDGELTLGENVADLGGVKLAYRAYKNLDDGRDVAAGGFDEDQQFFLAVGQAWCGKRTEERTRVLIQVDPHAPARFRVNGSLSNMPEFAEAFECDNGTPMNRQNTCSVW